jgi:hypothetical protein
MARGRMSDEGTVEPHRKAANLKRTGFTVSAVYLTGVVALGYTAGWSPLALEPNAVGDLLAGVFAPLAFLWLVLGYFQQGEELRASVRALEIQGEELQKSVEQQRALVQISREQFEVEDARARAAIEDAELRSLPFFVFTGTVSNMEDRVIYRLEFKNYRAQASAVTIGIGGTQKISKDFVREGESIGYEFDIERVYRGDLFGRISFLDQKGRGRGQTFYIHADVEDAGLCAPELDPIDEPSFDYWKMRGFSP